MGDGWSDDELNQTIELLDKAGGRFPAGIRVLPEGLVRAVQRARLLVAMTDAIAEIDYCKLTVQDVLARAGISRPTFYEQFADKEDCFVAAFDVSSKAMLEGVEAGMKDTAPDWQSQLRGGLTSLVEFIVEEPKAAYLVIVGARASCPEGLHRRDEFLGRLADCMDALVGAERDEAVSAVAAVGVVGGIDSVLHASLRRSESDELRDLLPALIDFAVLIYGGRTTDGSRVDDQAVA